MKTRSAARKHQTKAAKSGHNSFEYLFDDRTAARAHAGRRTRKREKSALNAGYVIFLAVMCIATVYMCVYFLQLKENVTSLNRKNARLETELTELQRDNEARYQNLTNNVDLDHIRDVAINKLNMKYASKEQIIWYNSASDGYVYQYTDVPDKDNG
jgi:cell division protein FtsL